MFKLISEIPKIITNKHKILLIILFIWTIFMSFAELLGLGSLVFLVSVVSEPEMIINKIKSSGLNFNITDLSHSKLISYSCYFLVVAFTIKSLVTYIFSYFAAKITMNINYYVSSSFFKNYLKKSYEKYLNLNSTKFANDIKDETLRFITFLFAFINIIRDVFLVMIIFITLMFTSSLATLSVFLAILIISSLIYLLLKKILRGLGNDKSKFNTKIYNILIETFNGIKNIKLIGAENMISKNYDRNNNNLLKNDLKVKILAPVPRIFLEWIAIVGISSLVIIFNFQNKDLNDFIPILTFIAVASIRLIPAFSAINQNVNHLNYNFNATSLIIKELKNQKRLDEKVINKKIRINSINLNKVNYKYNKNQNSILNNISFKIKKNQLIGIVGSSGSGKTTLVEVLLGLIEPLKGKIYINNKINIRNTKYFKNSISYVSQDIFLFEGTLLDNITFGDYNNNLDKKHLSKIIEICELQKLIQKNKDGINLKIKENGKNLSGGEMQRIAIARALFRKPSLIVLDEATSSLDIQLEKKIIDNLNKIIKDKIIFMIAHRLTSLKYCNKLMLIDNGTIVDFDYTNKILDKHKELKKFLNIKKN